MPQDPQFGDSFRIAFPAFERKCFLKKKFGQAHPKLYNAHELDENKGTYLAGNPGASAGRRRRLAMKRK